MLWFDPASPGDGFSSWTGFSSLSPVPSTCMYVCMYVCTTSGSGESLLSELSRA